MDQRLRDGISSLLPVFGTLSQVRQIWQHEGAQPEAYKNACFHIIVLAPKAIHRRLHNEC